MKLNILSNNPGAKKVGKRVGRGIGSGKGKTCGRGVKGQKSRSGVAIKGFEGGQTSIIKRLSKRGFNCPNSKKYKIVKLETLIELAAMNLLDISKIVTKNELIEAGLIKNSRLPVKLLTANREPIKQKITIDLDAYSATAKEFIEQAGGKIL